MTKRWRAEMPPRHLGRVDASELTCHADDVDELITRANAELDAAEAGNRELRERVVALELEAEAAHERVAILEARIRELTEWVRGEPDDNSRHWALVLHDAAKAPRVMQWEPTMSRWCIGDGYSYPWYCYPNECVHMALSPLPSTEGES